MTKSAQYADKALNRKTKTAWEESSESEEWEEWEEAVEAESEDEYTFVLGGAILNTAEEEPEENDPLDEMSVDEAVWAYQQMPHAHLPVLEPKSQRPWVEPLVQLLSMGAPVFKNWLAGRPLVAPLPESKQTALSMDESWARIHASMNNAENRELLIEAMNRALDELEQSPEIREGGYAGELNRGRALSKELEATFHEELSETLADEVLDYLLLSDLNNIRSAKRDREAGSARHDETASHALAPGAEAILSAAISGANRQTPLLPVTVAAVTAAAGATPLLQGTAAVTTAATKSGWLKKTALGSVIVGIPSLAYSVYRWYSSQEEAVAAESIIAPDELRDIDYQLLEEAINLIDKLETPYLDFLFYEEPIIIEISTPESETAYTTNGSPSDSEEKIREKRSIESNLPGIKKRINELRKTVGIRGRLNLFETIERRVNKSLEVKRSTSAPAEERDVIYILKYIETINAFLVNLNKPQQENIVKKLRAYIEKLWEVADGLTDPFAKAKIAQYKDIFLSKALDTPTTEEPSSIRAQIDELQKRIGFNPGSSEARWLVVVRDYVVSSKAMENAANLPEHEKSIVYLLTVIEAVDNYFKLLLAKYPHESAKFLLLSEGLWNIAEGLTDPVAQAQVEKLRGKIDTTTTATTPPPQTTEAPSAVQMQINEVMKNFLRGSGKEAFINTIRERVEALPNVTDPLLSPHERSVNYLFALLDLLDDNIINSTPDSDPLMHHCRGELYAIGTELSDPYSKRMMAEYNPRRRSKLMRSNTPSPLVVQEEIDALEKRLNLSSNPQAANSLKELWASVNNSPEVRKAALLSPYERSAIRLIKAMEIISKQPGYTEQLPGFAVGLHGIAETLYTPSSVAMWERYQQLPSSWGEMIPTTIDPDALKHAIDNNGEKALADLAALYNLILDPAGYLDDYIDKALSDFNSLKGTNISKDHKISITVEVKTQDRTPGAKDKFTYVPIKTEEFSLREIASGQFRASLDLIAPGYALRREIYSSPQDMPLVLMLWHGDLQQRMLDALAEYSKSESQQKMKEHYDAQIKLRCLEYLDSSSRLPGFEEAVMKFLEDGKGAKEVFFQGVKLNGVFLIPHGSHGGVLFSVDEPGFFHVHSSQELKFQPSSRSPALQSTRVSEFPASEDFRKWVLNKMPFAESSKYKTTSFRSTITIEKIWRGLGFPRLERIKVMNRPFTFTDSPTLGDLKRGLFDGLIERLRSDINKMIYTPNERVTDSWLALAKEIMRALALVSAVALPCTGTVLRRVAVLLANLAIDAAMVGISIEQSNRASTPEEADAYRNEAIISGVMGLVGALPIGVPLGVQGAMRARQVYRGIKSTSGQAIPQLMSKLNWLKLTSDKKIEYLANILKNSDEGRELIRLTDTPDAIERTLREQTKQLGFQWDVVNNELALLPQELKNEILRIKLPKRVIDGAPASALPSEMGSYLSELKSSPKLANKIFNPTGSCETILTDVANFMKDKGFENIRYRGMFFRTSKTSSVDNHFVVLGSKNGQDFVFDLTAGQFANKGMPSLDGPLILPEAAWAQRYQTASSRRLIIYKDFTEEGIATRAFHPGNALNTGRVVEGSTILTEPQWFKSSWPISNNLRTAVETTVQNARNIDNPISEANYLSGYVHSKPTPAFPENGGLFYHEVQRIDSGTCAIHAANAYRGSGKYRVGDFADAEQYRQLGFDRQQAIDFVLESGNDFSVVKGVLDKVEPGKNIMAINKTKEELGTILDGLQPDIDRVMVALSGRGEPGGHWLTFRKAANGKWYKIDSSSNGINLTDPQPNIAPADFMRSRPSQDAQYGIIYPASSVGS